MPSDARICRVVGGSAESRVRRQRACLTSSMEPIGAQTRLSSMRYFVLVFALVAGATACVSESKDGPRDAERTDTLATTSPASPTPSPSAVPPTGDAAMWSLVKRSRPGADTSRFTASVSRLGCNGGVTGQVYPPSVEYEDTRIVVTFAVNPVTGLSNCQGNRSKPFEVVLAEPIGDRQLFDGQCLTGSPGEGTSFCEPDGVRWAGP